MFMTAQIVLFLVAVAVVVIAGLWTIARIQNRRKYDTLTAVLMILTIIALGTLCSYLVMWATG
jgi:hypothetical protein